MHASSASIPPTYSAVLSMYLISIFAAAAIIAVQLRNGVPITRSIAPNLLPNLYVISSVAHTQEVWIAENACMDWEKGEKSTRKLAIKIDQEIEPPDLPSPNPSDSDNRPALFTCPSMTTNRASRSIDIKCEVQAPTKGPPTAALPSGVTCLEHSAALPSGVTCAQFYFTSHIHLLYWCLPLDPSTRSRHPRSPPYHPDNTLRSLPHHFSGLPQKFHQTTCHDRYFPLDIAPGAFGKSISPSLVHTSNSGCEGGVPSKLNKMKSLRRETHHSASLMINGFWPTTDTEMSSPTRTRSLMVPARRINLAPSSRRIFPRARLTISHPPILPPKPATDVVSSCEHSRPQTQRDVDHFTKAQEQLQSAVAAKQEQIRALEESSPMKSMRLSSTGRLMLGGQMDAQGSSSAAPQC